MFFILYNSFQFLYLFRDVGLPVWFSPGEHPFMVSCIQLMESYFFLTRAFHNSVWVAEAI